MGVFLLFQNNYYFYLIYGIKYMVRLEKGGERVNSAKSVRELAERLKKEETNLSSAVWQTSLACVGYPYVYAAWKFQECTPSNRKSRNGGSTTPSKDHPTIITACQYLNGTKNTCKGCKWYPKDERVWMFDCRGFTHDMLALFGIQLSGQGCTTQWNTASNWKAKGTIDTIPDDILVCLFYPNKTNPQKMEHTGFGFRGETVECSSGVQHFTKRKAKWTHWAIPVGIDGDIPDYRPTLKRGSTGEYVTLLQTKLINKGYDLGSWGADGKFGAKTEEAVKAFQKDWGLEPDGVVGTKTWEMLDSAPSRTLYTVHIPYLTVEQADALLKQYPGSTKEAEKR